MKDKKIIELAEKAREVLIADPECSLVFDLMSGIPAKYLLGEGVFFGDYFVGILADLLGYNDDKKIVDVSMAFLLARGGVIATDQIIDGKGKVECALASPLYTLQVGKRFEAVTGGRFTFEQIFGLYEVASKANLSEKTRHQNKTTEYGADDIDVIVRKTNAITLPIIALGYLADRRESVGTLISAMNHILFSIQMCDDIADYDDDSKAGNRTLVLTKSLLINSEGALFGDWEALVTQAIPSVLDMATERLSKALREMETINSGRSFAERYVENLIEHISGVKSRLSNALSESEAKNILEELEPAKIAPGRLGLI